MNDVSGESHSAISSFLRLSATGKVPGPKEVGLCRGTQRGHFSLKKQASWVSCSPSWCWLFYCQVLFFGFPVCEVCFIFIQGCLGT